MAGRSGVAVLWEKPSAHQAPVFLKVINVDYVAAFNHSVAQSNLGTFLEEAASSRPPVSAAGVCYPGEPLWGGSTCSVFRVGGGRRQLAGATPSALPHCQLSLPLPDRNAK